jgi:FAD/FMN-containing dehydrogenase
MPVDTQRGDTISPATYYELRRFYLDQLDARDQGRTQEWLDVFDDNATITTRVLGHGSPVQKSDFVPAIWELDDSFHKKGIQRRHCVHSFTFTARDGLFYSRFYALFLVTDAAHGARLQSAAKISDVLRKSGSTWQVMFREIERDDLGRLNGQVSGLPLSREGEQIMDQNVTAGRSVVPAEVYSSVDQFYARQMQALDDGDVGGWAQTFTADGVFASNGLPDPVVGREQLTKLASDTVARLNGQRAIRRHFVFNVIVETAADGLLRTTCYVPVFDTVNGVTSLTTSTVMRDELVSSGDDLLVRHRTVTRDDLVALSRLARPGRGSITRSKEKRVTPSQTLEMQLERVALRPGTVGYEEARSGLQRSYLHRPSVAVRARGVDDVRLAVRYAAERGLAVAVQATGHGLNVPTEGGVLIDTAPMADVRVDPVSRIAWAAAGTRWEQVIAAASEHGLAPLSGSSADVGVMGYTLSGGLPLLGREFGYAADHVRQVELVTADGEFGHAKAGEDLFWAIRGGGGNFGVVTGLEFDLVPAGRLYGGGVYFDADKMPAVLKSYREWTATVPDRMSSSIGLIPLPDMPQVPAPLRGRHVAHVRIAYLGTAEDGERLVAPLRGLGPSLLDNLGEMPYTATGRIHNEPRQPRNFYCANAMLAEFDPSVPDTVLDLVGPGTEVFAVVQFNHLGGALARPPEVPNAVPHRGARFALRVVTTPAGPERDAAHETADALIRAVAPWTLGRSASFVQGERGAHELASECFEPAAYARLAAIKAVYDPGNMFRCNVNIAPALKA